MLPCFSLLPSPNKQQHKGYGHFTPPCVGIESIEVGAIDIDFLSVLSGSPKGNHRQDFRYCVYWRRPLNNYFLLLVVPIIIHHHHQQQQQQQPGTVGLDVTLQLNNTNPFGIVYKQNKQGLISHGDQQIGFFTIPDGTSHGMQSSTSKIAATLRAGPDGLDMATASAFMGGNKVTIGFSGEISAVGWLDSAPAIVGFQCNATVTGLSGAEAEVDCYAQYVIEALNERGSASVTHEEMQRVNTACYV